MGERLAEKLGYLYFDTGVMYRAVAWAALQRGVSLDDEEAVGALSRTLRIDVRPPSKENGRAADVLIDGEDVTWSIRGPEVDASVSLVAAYSEVRRALTEKQRRVGRRGRVVMVGRDIGTVVLPEADIKLYLEASVEERARRRYRERVERGESVSFEAILASMRRRDTLDSNRAIAPMRPAEDAIIIDSDDKTADEVLAEVESLMQ